MRPGAAAVCLLASLLAGCSGAPAPSDPVGEGPSVVTDPRDLSYLANATPGSHVHDYWGGRDRMPVMDVEGSVWSTCSGDCGHGATGAWRRPKEGAIVPQGTRWVNGTFSFTPDPEHDATSYELWVKTAEDREPRRIQRLVPGEPFSLEVRKEQNDPPHYVLSLWQFEVVAKKDAQGVSFRGDFRWDVEAVRGLPLDPYPPHPDRWGGADELLLLEDGGDALLYYEQDGMRACYGAFDRCPGWHVLPDGVVVPHDATRVEVRIGGTFLMPMVEFHGADTWTFREAAGRQDGAETVFDIPLGQTLGDSPYAPQSLWEFRVGLGQPTPTEAGTGTYTMLVTAYK